MNMTELKEQLPTVKVRLNKKVYVGHIKGRNLDFPFVCVDMNGIPIQLEFCWDTILNAVNNNTVLIGN